MGSANPASCSTAVFTIENNPCISEPAQFKPVLFKVNCNYLLIRERAKDLNFRVLGFCPPSATDQLFK